MKKLTVRVVMVVIVLSLFGGTSTIWTTRGYNSNERK